MTSIDNLLWFTVSILAFLSVRNSDNILKWYTVFIIIMSSLLLDYKPKVMPKQLPKSQTEICFDKIEFSEIHQGNSIIYQQNLLLVGNNDSALKIGWLVEGIYTKDNRGASKEVICDLSVSYEPDYEYKYHRQGPSFELDLYKLIKGNS